MVYLCMGVDDVELPTFFCVVLIIFLFFLIYKVR